MNAPRLTLAVALIAAILALPSVTRAATRRAHAPHATQVARPKSAPAVAPPAGPAAPAPTAADSVKAIWAEARELANQGKHDEALSVLERGLALHPGSTDLLWLEAAVYGYRGDHKEAARRYDQLLADHPELARDLRMDVAGERLAAGDTQGALRELDLRIAEVPTDRDAARMRAQALADENRLREALAAYDRLVSEDPSDLESALARARILGWLGEHEAAIAAYRTILAQDSTREAAQYGIAQNENWAGRHREAAALYDSLRRAPSADPEADKGLAYAYYWSGHSGLAEAPIERYLARRPDDLEARDLADKIARERSPGVALGFGRQDDSDGLRVETRAVDVRFPLAGESAMTLQWKRLLLRDAGGSFDPTYYGLGLEKVADDLWILHGTIWAYTRDRDTDAIGVGDASVTWKPRDPLRFDLAAAKDVVDTRLATALFITYRTAIAGVDWNVSDPIMLHLDGRVRDYSDGNHATQVAALARARVQARRNWRAYLGARVEQLHVDQNLDHGYYDPYQYTEGGPELQVEWEPNRQWSLAGDFRTGWQQELGSATEPFYNLSGSAEVLLGRVAVLRFEGGISNSNLSATNGYEQRRWAISLSRSFFK